MKIIVFRRRMIYLLCVFILFCCSVSTVMAEQTSDVSAHAYKLFLRADGSGYYAAVCTVDGCNDCLAVYPQGYEVEPTTTEGECQHIFRYGDKIERVSIEPASGFYHEVAQWHTCVCEVCGETIDAYDTDGSMYLHVVTTWEDEHINGEHKHLYVGYCDACGRLQFDVVDCMQYNDGTCMGGRDYTPPASPPVYQ